MISASAEKLYLSILGIVAAFNVLILVLFGGLQWQLLLAAAFIATILGGFAMQRLRWWHSSDERLLKIIAWSGRNTFLTTLALLALMAVSYDLGYHLGLMPRQAIDVGDALFGGGIVMFVLFAVWNVYYTLKGDVA